MININLNIINEINKAKSIAIFTHVNPDGDCLGSASALKQIILELDNSKEIDIFCEDNISENFKFLKYIDQTIKESDETYDLGIAVDCSDLNRLGITGQVFKRCKNTIKIDHHKSQENFAKINVVEPLSSNCLILYYYALNMLNNKLNKDIACSLYAGIASDTGCFIHSNTTYEEHIVASELIKYGFNLEETNTYLFKIKTIEQVNLQKIALNNLKFFLNGKLAISYLTLKDFKDANASRNDTTGLSEYVSNISGVLVGVTISEERKGLFRCSFRSKKNIDVDIIAQKFGGGGHMYAAGCNIFGYLNTVINKIVEVVEEQINSVIKN